MIHAGGCGKAAPTSIEISSHLGCALRFYNNHNALIARLVPGIDILPHILLGHTVDKIQRRIFLDLYNPTANLEVTIWIGWIDNRDSYPRISLNILKLLACLGLAEPQGLTCGPPFGPIVATLASAVLSNRSRYCAGIVIGRVPSS